MALSSTAPPPDAPTRILDAAEAIVRRAGVAALTLEAAAREAGVSKGGLLYHYGSKEALLTGLLNPAFRMPAYDLFNARVGLEGKNWNVALWGRNLTNKLYTTFAGTNPNMGWPRANYGGYCRRDRQPSRSRRIFMRDRDWRALPSPDDVEW